MCSAPGLHARDVHRALEVVAVVGLGQPGALAGGLAGPAALGPRAVPLAFAVAMVGIKKEFATQALALSRLRHGGSSTGSRNATPAAAREPSGHSLKKTDPDPKKTRQRRSSEEDGSGRRCTFTPAEMLQVRVGGHTPKPNAPSTSSKNAAPPSSPPPSPARSTCGLPHPIERRIKDPAMHTVHRTIDRTPDRHHNRAHPLLSQPRTARHAAPDRQ